MEMNISDNVLELLREMNNDNSIESASQIIERLQGNDFSIDELFLIISSSDVITKKIDALNLLAVSAYNQAAYDFVIPMLQVALEYDPDDTNTLYNLSEVLSVFGETVLALSYAEKIKEPGEEVKELIQKLTTLAKSEKSITEDILNIEQNDVYFTGERLVINQQVKDNFNNVLEEHIYRYELACKYVKNKVVLDAACGAGYGSKMLQTAGATFVTGVDIDQESLENAKNVYSADNINFIYGDVNRLELDDKCMDVVVSFETIEHISEGAQWIKESARVLKDEGIFLVSTPNRAITNPGTYFVEQTMNPHHRFEYNIMEFVGELLKEYELLELYGQSFINDDSTYYSIVMRQARQLNSTKIPYQNPIHAVHSLLPMGEVKDAQPMYVVAVCKKKKK